jgi:hypothetical protein
MTALLPKTMPLVAFFDHSDIRHERAKEKYARAPSNARHSTFCVPHRRNRPVSDPEIGENCLLTPPLSLW